SAPPFLARGRRRAPIPGGATAHQAVKRERSFRGRTLHAARARPPSSTSDKALYRIVFLFFFLSGFSSLVFEVIWARMLTQVFGTTSFAISTLLTAFMSGLALGSVIGGRYAARIRNPLRAYALIEGLIGLYAFVVPALLGLLPGIYGLLFN